MLLFDFQIPKIHLPWKVGLIFYLFCCQSIGSDRKVSTTSFERLVGNANGIADQGGRIYEGLWSRYPLPRIVADSLQRMPGQFAFVKEDLCKALTDASSQKIQEGCLTFIHTGWKNHAIYLVFCDGYLVLCNRGQTPRGVPTIYAFKIDPSKFTEEIYKCFLHHEKADPLEAIPFFYSTLPDLLHGKKDPFCLELETLSNRRQKIRNCPFTIKAALRIGAAFLLRRRGVAVRDCLAQARDFSKQWSTFFRVDTLNRYMDEGERYRYFWEEDTQRVGQYPQKRDNLLIQSVLKKLKKRIPADYDLRRFVHVRAALRGRVN